MPKVRVPLLLLGASIVAAGTAARGAGVAVAGRDAPRCAAGAGPAMLVRVTGFRTRTGVVRIQSYGGDPGRWFDKGSYLERVEARVPAQGPLEVCLGLPQPGRYAVSVRHDANGSGKADRGDGGGMSGNPELSLFDLLFRRKPDATRVGVTVPPHAVRAVPIVLTYLSGTRFRPTEAAN